MLKLGLFKKFRLSWVGFIACLISGLIALFAISFNIGERYAASQEPEPDQSVFKTTYVEERNYSDEIIIYDAMHRMANSKLTSESKDKSGKLDITKNQIEAIKTIVASMKYPDSSYIIRVLGRWEKGDFSLIADEHDYFASRSNNSAVNEKGN
jgi:hypothetical protein